MAENPKRLTPKPDVLRELFARSGNSCAMTACKHVIVDNEGVMVGKICHIEAVKPDGARFNLKMTNEQRREASNLILMCEAHHRQIDHKKYESKWTLAKVRELKRNHEKKFKAIGSTLHTAFIAQFQDNTDSLIPSTPHTFKKLSKSVPECYFTNEELDKTTKDFKSYIAKLSVVPKTERDFILALLKRAEKLEMPSDFQGRISLDVDDIASSMSLGRAKIRTLSAALERYKVGHVYDNGEGNYFVVLTNPSEYVDWSSIIMFCKKSNTLLEKFVRDLAFDLLD